MSAVARLLDRHNRGQYPLRVLSASGQLGYGIPAAPFERGLEWKPDFVGCDMGSVDPGPAYLGSGQMAPSREIAKRDLRLVLKGARKLDAPLILGTAGTAGAQPHLAETLAIVREIAAEEGLSFRLAGIAADIPSGVMIDALRNSRLDPLGEGIDANEKDIAASGNIVGQMGTEAFVRALEADVDVVIAGRACDTAIFAALPQMLGYDLGLAMQMAKIIECTSICCVPGGRDPMTALLYEDRCVLESTHPDRNATPVSVAAHALYEQADPDVVVEPEGALRLEDAVYEPVDGRRLSVSGGRWVPAKQPSVKIEGAMRLGDRAVLVAATADPGFIDGIDEIAEEVEATVRGMVTAPFTLSMRRYGLGELAPRLHSDPMPREVFLLVEVIAETRDAAKAVLGVFKQYLLHHGFPRRLCTGGNIAFPFTPPELDAGSAWVFNLYHRMEVDDLASLFPVTLETL